MKKTNLCDIMPDLICCVTYYFPCVWRLLGHPVFRSLYKINVSKSSAKKLVYSGFTWYDNRYTWIKGGFHSWETRCLFHTLWEVHIIAEITTIMAFGHIQTHGIVFFTCCRCHYIVMANLKSNQSMWCCSLVHAFKWYDLF